VLIRSALAADPTAQYLFRGANDGVAFPLFE
jgi:hypothetical protein